MNYCAKENCFCDFATERGYCHHSLCDHKITNGDTTQPTTTHSAVMEVEQELKKIEACLYELDQIIAWGDEKFDDDSCKYINNLLKSRRDALTSQQVIR